MNFEFSDRPKVGRAGFMPMTKRLKTYFLRGMAALLPTILTIWLFIWGYQFIKTYISDPISYGLVWLIAFFRQADEQTRQQLVQYWVNGLGSIAGFIIALIIVCMLGVILASVLGKSFWRMVENSILRTPLLNKIYPYLKQITDFLLTRKKLEFSRVVAVQYPRKGIWSIGLVTGSGLENMKDDAGNELITIFIPTSPTPFTGFVILVPKTDVKDLDISVEDALRFTVSAGVITPQNNQINNPQIEENSDK